MDLQQISIFSHIWNVDKTLTGWGTNVPDGYRDLPCGRKMWQYDVIGPNLDILQQKITLKMADQERSDFYVVFAALTFVSGNLLS